MIFLSAIAFILIVVAIVFLLDLTPDGITQDIISVLTPKKSLQKRAVMARKNKGEAFIVKKVLDIKEQMEFTGKTRHFAIICTLSMLLFVVGILLCHLMGNYYMLISLPIILAVLPFFYITQTMNFYNRRLKAELETALTIISTSYNRNEDIVRSVQENMEYIRPPLRDSFQIFVGEATAVSSNIKIALLNLRERVENDIFREWCDTLIQCQDDRTMKDTLLQVVNRLTDVRIVNSELVTILQGARSEYWTMVVIYVLNIPAFAIFNREWFDAIWYSTPGKIVLAISFLAILITVAFMFKFTKPMEYKN